MFLNSVFLLAFAGAVRAAVIINVYEADGEKKQIHSLNDGCNNRACDQLCRRLGFTGGVCVGDKCKCDNFAPVTENKLAYTVESGCNLGACEQLCRRLGFPGGVCVGDRCECDNFKPITVKGTALEYLLGSVGKISEFHSLHDCNIQACDQLCRNLGFPGGACVGDRCDCDNFMDHKHKEDEYLVVNDATDEKGESGDNMIYEHIIIRQDTLGAVYQPRGCDAVKCSDMCHRMHYFAGICSNGSCECY